MADLWSFLRLVLGSVLVLIVPGLAWTLLLFPQRRPVDAPKDAQGIDWIERGALAFGLSIAIVPITVFTLSRFAHMPLTTGAAVLIVLALTIVPLILWRLERAGRAPWRRRPPSPEGGAPAPETRTR